MTNHWQKKTLTLCISAAIAQVAVGTARADSAVGVNTMLGNALNPNTLKTIPARDPDGLDAQFGQRTPTGKLHGWPTAVPTTTTTASGWTYNGQAEIGWMGAGGDTSSWWYNQYKDLPTNGLYLNNFYFKADQTEKGQGYFVEALGGGVGYRDQYEGINFGRYNDWKVKVFYNEIPHMFTSTYRSLWQGVGSDYLTLNQLKPGGTLRPATPARPGVPAQTNLQNSATATRNNIVNQLNNTDLSQLELVRKTGGLTVDKWITNNWKFYGSYSNEQREGARPFGMVVGGGGGGGNVEVPESIDYNTQDLIGALRYDDGVNNLNLQLNFSWFKNNIDTLTVENPLFATLNGSLPIAPNVLNPSVFTTGQYDLYPDNNYTNLRAEYARSMPNWFHSRLTATASLSKYQQDDNLIPWTTNSLQGMSFSGVNAFNKWNTTAALTKQSADAEIDTKMFDIGLVMRPTDKLDVNGKIRYYSTDNKTEFFACNPLTGQWGRLINDGTGASLAVPSAVVGNNPVGTLPTAYNRAGCNLEATQTLGLAPTAANLNIRNVPFEYSKTDYELGGEYRITRGQSVNGKIAREVYDREHRERDQTWENIFRAGYVNRAFSFGTLRASVEYGERRGDTYNVAAYEEFNAGVLGPLPTANTTPMAGFIHGATVFRKYDLADRDRLALDARLDLIARQNLDVGITGQYRDMDYPDSDLGRNDHQSLGSISLDVNWQPSAKFGVSGWWTLQESGLQQNGLQANNCTMGNWYFFYSDGFVGTAATNVAPTRRGTTVVNRVQVNKGNWQGVCETPDATSPLFPSGRGWLVETDDSNNAFGLNARYDLGFARLELDGTYIEGTTSIDYNYNQDALALTPTAVGLASTGMPDQNYNQQILNFNIVVPINKSVAIRALYRYEQGSIDDWHYDGVYINPVPTLAGVAQSVYLDSGPQDYHTNTVGLLVQVTF